MGRRQELSSEDIKLEQPPSIEIPSEGAIERPAEVVTPLEAADKDDYVDQLAFNEEPVTIELLPGQDENAPPSIPVWVNGVGAQVLINGKWVVITYLPVGRQITVKRKVLETIARAKPTHIKTNVVEQPGKDPVNMIDRRNYMRYPFNIIEDKNPKGRDWLSRILAER